MDAQLKRGLLEVCVLAAIKSEDSYGYKIIKDMKPYIELSESTLYTILKRLESVNMLTVRTAEHGGRLRKWILALRQYRCRVLPRRKQAVGGGEDGRNKRSHHRLPARVVQAMLDILYFLLCGVLGAVFLYWQNSGILRWYLILGGAIGFFAYSRSLGRWMLPLFQLGISVIRAGMCALYNGILYYPVYMIDRILIELGGLCKKAGNAVVRTVQRRRCRRRIRKILCTEEPVQKKRRPRRQKEKE